VAGCSEGSCNSSDPPGTSRGPGGLWVSVNPEELQRDGDFIEEETELPIELGVKRAADLAALSSGEVREAGDSRGEANGAVGNETAL